MNQYMFNQIKRVGATTRNSPSAIHLSNKYISSGHHVSGTALGTEDTFRLYVSDVIPRSGVHWLPFCLGAFWLVMFIREPNEQNFAKIIPSPLLESTRECSPRIYHTLPRLQVMSHFHPFRLPCISFHLPFLPSRHHPMSRGEPDPPDIINTLTFLVCVFFGENTNWTSIGGGLCYLFSPLLCTLFNLIHATQGKNDRFGAPSPDGELRVRMVLESFGRAPATQLGSPDPEVLSSTCHLPWPQTALLRGRGRAAVGLIIPVFDEYPPPPCLLGQGILRENL